MALKTARRSRVAPAEREPCSPALPRKGEVRPLLVCIYTVGSCVSSREFEQKGLRLKSRTRRDQDFSRSPLGPVFSEQQQRATSAVLEDLSSAIQSTKRVARGFGNLKYFRAAIFFRLDGLDFSA